MTTQGFCGQEPPWVGTYALNWDCLRGQNPPLRAAEGPEVLQVPCRPPEPDTHWSESQEPQCLGKLLLPARGRSPTVGGATRGAATCPAVCKAAQKKLEMSSAQHNSTSRYILRSRTLSRLTVTVGEIPTLTDVQPRHRNMT